MLQNAKEKANKMLQNAEEKANSTLRMAEEKDNELKKREEALARMYQPNDSNVTIRARGAKIVAKKSVLMTQKDSLLADVFSGANDQIVEKDNEGSYLVDSNPETFHLLIDLLKYGDQEMDQYRRGQLKREMKKWGIKTPKEVENASIASRLPAGIGKKLIAMFERDPK